MFQEVKHQQTSYETQPVLLDLLAIRIMMRHHKPSFMQINR